MPDNKREYTYQKTNCCETGVPILKATFGDRLQQKVSLARYTSARVGGAADYLLEITNAEELFTTVVKLWEMEVPFTLLAGGSNVLVSDRGIRGLVLLNRARGTGQIRFNRNSQPPAVWAEAGVTMSLVSRRAAQYGLAGIEWASAIPGTVGGAVVGNAGAFGGDIAGNLVMAEILHRTPLEAGNQISRSNWQPEQFAFGYHSSVLKARPGEAIVLRALLSLEQSTPEEVKNRTNALAIQRREAQPPGASTGSMFKNPGGDFAGRLIEAAGLKGLRIGEAEISPKHANFFINRGHATALDIYALVQQARQSVAEQFGIHLELEVRLLGEWCGGDALDDRKQVK